MSASVSESLPRTVVAEVPASDPALVLEHRMDFDVSQQSLDFTLRDLALIASELLPEGSFEIRLEGRDLQLDGITRNQQIRNLQLIDLTVGEILTAIVMRANPVPANSPDDPAQKLVWVVDPAAARPQLRILITTRSAAERQRLALPDAFRRPDPAARRNFAEQTVN
jgi:hypothetical protein